MVNFIVPLLAIFGILLTVIINRKIYLKKTKDLEERNKRLTALRRLDEIMMSSSTDLREVAQEVTDAIAYELGFEIGVLALVDESKGVLRREAMSRTSSGNQAKGILPIKYELLEIPIHSQDNLGIKALYSGQIQITDSLYEVMVPAITRELADKLQQTVNVKTSMVYPISARGKRIGVMIVSSSKDANEISNYDKESLKNLVDVVGVALDNATLYQNLRKTTQQLAEANIKLQQLDKLKDEFVSIASHELRTPMTAIRSYVWMALNRSDMQLTEKMEKYLSRTLLSTERLINLVNDMLNVSRIEAGSIEISPSQFDIIELAKEVADEVMPKAAEKGIKLIVESQNIPHVFADPDKVHQVLLNLIGNALKFTPKDGSITVNFFTDGQVLDVSVKDTGPGISKEDLAKLFQKFGRLDNSYVASATTGGTGLGLYISKRLIDLMHGKIWANSEGLGKGTTFTFSLPLASQQVLQNADKFTIKPIGGGKALEPATI